MAEEKIASLTVDGTGALSTLDQIDAKMEKVGGTVETNTRRLTSFGRDFQQIARSLGVYTDAWERVKRVQEAAQRAVDSGRISQEQANRVIEEAKLRYDETARAAKQAADEQERAGAEAARANAAAAQSLEQIRRQYDPTYAAAAKYRDEVARVSKAMEAAGVTGHEYAATLRAVAAALDPVTRAEREREEATARAAIETARAEQRAADETERARREMIEKARALQIAADAQDRYNRLLGISDLPSGSAASSASVFQESARAAEEEAQAQAALADELDRVRTRYDATYAEVRRYVTEMNRVTRVLELANASEEERARLLAAVAAEYDPIIKAENERAAAEQRAQEEAAQATAEMIERERATQRAADAQHRYNELLGVSSTRSSASRSAAVFEDADQQAQALQRLVDRLEPAAAAQRRFADQQRQLDDALAGGKIDEAAHTRLTKALKDQETAYYGAAVGARAHSRALQVLVPQLSDIAVQAQSGTGAFTILVQQGPQIAEGLAFAGKEAMVAAARFALMAAPVLAVGAGFATAIYGAMRFSSEVREAERVLALTGGAAGVSAQMIVGMSDALADSAHVSRSTAREIQTAYAGTGKIGRQMMVELTQQTRNWALSTGQETDKAAAELAAMFADPAKAADELVAKYGMLDPAQARLIKNYQAQGELGKAQAVLLDGITPRISNATSRVSALAEAYEWAARGVSNFIDSAGRGFAAEGPTVAALKAAADKAAREHQLDPNGYNWVNGAKLSTKEIADYTEQAYGEAFRKAEADSWFAAIGEADAEFRRLKKSVMDFAASVDPAIGAAQAYTNRQVELEKAVRTGATSQSEATRLLKLYRAQLLETMSPAQAFGEEMERQGRVLREQAGVLRDYESARQNELKKRGLKPSDTLPQRVEDSLYDGVLSLSKDRAADTHRSMVQATEDARELAAATASGSQAALIAAQAQVAYNKTLRETKDVGLARQAYSDAYEKGMTEWRGQLDASVTAAGVAVESARRLAAAQAKGGDIAMAQAQAQNVYAENIARGVDPTRALALAQAELQKSMASLEGQRAAWNRDLGEQIDAARRLAEAEGVSAAAVAEANVQNKVRAQILKEGVSAESDRARAIEAGTRALEAQNAIARVNATIRQGNRDLTLARAEYELLGRSNAERERAVAIMKATLEVQESAEWQAVPKATRDAWVAQAGAVAEYQARIADATETSRDFASTITKGFEDAIVAGGKLSDIAKGLEADFKRIIVRTIATKPMENLLTGSLTKLLAGAPSGDAKVKPVSASDPGGYRAAFEQLTGGKAGTLGTQSNPMIVQLAGGGQGITIGGVSGGGMLPVAVKDAGAFGAIADEMAAKYGVDAAIIKGIIQRESSWNASAVNSRSGAAGLMQVMPANWSAYGITNPYDPRQNIEAGTRIFREHLNRAGGDLDRALSTYSGHIKTSGAAYVSAVKDSAETYRRAGTTFQAVSTNAQSVATSQAVQIQAQQEGAATTQNLTAAQSDAVSAALSAVKSMDSASTAAEDIDARLGVASDGVSTAAEKLAAAQKQAAQSAVLFAQSSQQAGAYMVDGTQQALGALLSIAGAASGIKGGGIPGQVVQAGGPQGIANSFSQLGSLLKTDGIFGSNSAVSGVKSFLNSPMSASFSSYTAPQAASVAKTSTGMLAGGEGASTGMGTQAAGGGATWGDALGAVGYGFNAFQNFQQGNVIGGIGNTAAAVMMFIPGLQPFAPLVAIGSQLLGGLFGPNRGKPAAAAAVEYTNTKQTYAASAIDNEGDAEQAQQLLQSIDAATKQFIGITGGKTNGGFGIAVEAKEDKYRVRNGGAAGELGASYDTLDEAVIAGFRHNIAAGLVTVSDDVKTAVGKTTVKDINEFMADVSFGKNFRAQFDALNASLDPTSNQIKTWTEAAQQMGEQVKANVTDWKDTASRLGLATDKELTAAARKGITAMLGIGEAAEPLRGTEAVTKQAQIQFEAFKPALLALGYTAAEVADMAAKYTAKLVKTRDDAVALTQRQGSAAIEALVNPGAKTPVLDRLEGLGLDRKNSVIVGVAAAIDSVEQAASRGTLTIEDERRALATLNAQFAAGYLTADQYTTSVGYLTQAWTDSAAAAERAAQRVAYTADLNSRMHAAVGNARGSGLLALDQQQAVELAQARANGYDTAQLAQVQAAERGQKAFELAQADVLAAYDQQISAQQDLITSLQEGAVAAAAVARQFRQAYNALALDENSPLSAYERLMEARRQFEEAASTATSGTATDTEKTAAQTLLQQLGPTLVQLAQAYFANSNRDDYDRVRSVFDRLGTTSTDSADTADRQLQAANETLKELQRSRSDAARFGERQFGAISGLKDVMDQSYAIWQAALAPLQRLTGTTPGTSQPTTVNSSRYAAPAAVQADWDSLSAGQQTAVVRGIGWQGKVDEALNVWLATTSGKSGAFESAVSTTAEKRRRLLAFSNSDIEAAFGHFADIQAARSADPGFNLAQWFRDFGMDEVLSGSRRIPGFARGTMETPPGAVWVGERGPELLWQGGGAAVASSADSVRIAAMYQSAANDRLPVNYAAFGPRQSAAQQMDITPLLYRIEALTKEVQHLRAERSRDAIGQAAIAEQNLAVNARGHQQTAAALNRQKLMQRAA